MTRASRKLTSSLAIPTSCSAALKVVSHGVGEAVNYRKKGGIGSAISR